MRYTNKVGSHKVTTIIRLSKSVGYVPIGKVFGAFLYKSACNTRADNSNLLGDGPGGDDGVGGGFVGSVVVVMVLVLVVVLVVVMMVLVVVVMMVLGVLVVVVLVVW